MERLADAVEEMKPWRAEFEGFGFLETDPNLKELHAGFSAHMDSAMSAHAQGKKAF